MAKTQNDLDLATDEEILPEVAMQLRDRARKGGLRTRGEFVKHRGEKLSGGRREPRSWMNRCV